MTKQTGDYIDDLRAQLAGARSALVREEARTRRLVRERDDARASARILAHAYSTDNRPPAKVVDDSLAYPVEPEAPKSKWQKGSPVVEVKGSKHPACLSDCRGEGCCGGCRT